MSSLTNPFRLLLRNLEELDAPRLLLAMPPVGAGVATIADELPETEVRAFTTLVEVKEQVERVLGADRVNYSHLPGPTKELFHVAVLFLQKSRPLMESMVELLCPLLKKDGYLLLVGENGSGIKSWKKRLANYGEVETIDSACHSGLIRLDPDNEVRESDKTISQSSFNIEVAGQGIDVVSLPGVFSHGRLDVGTRLLLETLSKEIVRGKVLDFGCGAGVIGSWLAARHGRCRPTLLDADAIAIEASRRTLAANGLEGKVVASHGLAQAGQKYDWIISNPPFHEGVKTRYDVTESFLRDCRNHLCRGGQLRIVANSFLKYRSLIEEAFGHCEELARADGFTIYGATLGKEFQPNTFDTAG